MKCPLVHAHVTFQIFNLLNFRTPNVQTRETLELEAVKLSNVFFSNSRTRELERPSNYRSLKLCTGGIFKLFKLQPASNFKLSSSGTFKGSNSQRRGRPNLGMASNSELETFKLSNLETFKLGRGSNFRARDASNSRTLNLETPSNPKLSKFDSCSKSGSPKFLKGSNRS